MSRFERVRWRVSAGRKLAVVLAAVAFSVGLVVVGSGSASSSSSPARNPTVQGGALVQEFFTLLKKGDREALKALLAPSFQVVRANGGVQNKTSYLANPPKVNSFKIAKVKGTTSAGVLVVSYQVTVTEKIAGNVQPTSPAPRLSVFQWQGGAWHLVAHANFGAITT